MARLLIAPSTSPISSAPRGADGMGCRTNRNALGHRFGDPAQLAHGLGNDIAQHTGDDDDRFRDGHNTAEFLGHTHADGRGDGLRQQGNIILMVESEQNTQSEYRSHAGQHTGNNADQNGLDVAHQQGELLVQRNGQADGGRGEQVAQVLRTGVVALVVHVQQEQNDDGDDDGDKQRVADRRLGLFLNPQSELVAQNTNHYPEIGGGRQNIVHYFFFLSRRMTAWVARPETAMTKMVVTTVMTAMGSRTACKDGQLSSRPTQPEQRVPA